jgi:hypothetical protein
VVGLGALRPNKTAQSGRAFQPTRAVAGPRAPLCAARTARSASRSTSQVGRCQVHVQIHTDLPLTPALSLGEREKRVERFGRVKITARPRLSVR